MNIFEEIAEAAKEAVEKAEARGEKVSGSFCVCLETREIVRLTPEEELERKQEELDRYGLEEWPEDTRTISYFTPEENAEIDRLIAEEKALTQEV